MTESEILFGHKLSTRTHNALVMANLTTKQQVVDAYIGGTLFHVRNMGKVSFNEIHDWLDKEIDRKLKPSRFAINKITPKPITPDEKLLRSIGYVKKEIEDLKTEMSEIKYVLEQWTRANHALHQSMTVVGIERKYITNTQ